MKKILLFVTFVSICLLSSPMNAQAPTTQWAANAVTSWYNTTDATFNLTTPNELAGLSVLVLAGNNFTGKTINLSNDIDLGAHLWTPIGKSVAISFGGTFNGNDHVISNMYTVNLTTSFVGLFGQITGATVKNVVVSNPTVISKDDAGCLAGGTFGNSLVQNCHVTGGSISGTGNNIGGLVGSHLGSLISKSSANTTVTGSNQVGGLVGSPYNAATIEECFAMGSVSGLYNVGGIAGFSAFAFPVNGPVTINNCYSRNTVTSTNGPAGGIYGGSSAVLFIKNSYATGLITSTGNIGGLIGSVGNITAINDYWNTETTEAAMPVGTFTGAIVAVEATGKTTAEMKTAAMVDLLNLNQATTPWTIDATKNDGYPILSSVVLNTNSFATTNGINVYPTLVNDMITISSTANLVQYSLYSVSGSKVKAGLLSANQATIQMENIAGGIYLLSVQTQLGSTTHKIVKK